MSKLLSILTRGKEEKEKAKANKLYKEASREQARILVEKERAVESLQDKIEDLLDFDSNLTIAGIKETLSKVVEYETTLSIAKEELEITKEVFANLFDEDEKSISE